MSDTRDRFDISPQQYHAGLDRLWGALRVTGPQLKDVFTLAAERIHVLESENRKLRERLGEATHEERMLCECESCVEYRKMLKVCI